MDLPSLPPAGDNLYKWVAMIGLLVTAGSFGYPALEERTLLHEAETLKSDIYPLRLELQLARQAEQAALDELHRAGAPLLLRENEKQKKGDWTARPGDEEMVKAARRAADLHQQTAAETAKTAADLQHKAIQLEVKEGENLNKRRNANRTATLAILGQVAGPLLLLFGVVFWHHRTQRPQDAILQAEVPGVVQPAPSAPTPAMSSRTGLALSIIGVTTLAMSWAVPAFVDHYAQGLNLDAKKERLQWLQDFETALMSRSLMKDGFDRLQEKSRSDPHESRKQAQGVLERLVSDTPDLKPLLDRFLAQNRLEDEADAWRTWAEVATFWGRLGLAAGFVVVATGLLMNSGVFRRRAGASAQQAPGFREGEGI